MRKILALCAALALSVVMVLPAAALSNNGVHTTIAYSVSYIDNNAGPVTCTGTHQYGKQWPGTATTGGRDSFTCTSTTGSPLWNVIPGQVVPEGIGAWGSDYFYYTVGLYVTNTIAFSLTVSSDGLSYSGVAGYY
jgi:hypothetical protein